MLDRGVWYSYRSTERPVSRPAPASNYHQMAADTACLKPQSQNQNTLGEMAQLGKTVSQLDKQMTGGLKRSCSLDPLPRDS